MRKVGSADCARAAEDCQSTSNMAINIDERRIVLRKLLLKGSLTGRSYNSAHVFDQGVRWTGLKPGVNERKIISIQEADRSVCLLDHDHQVLCHGAAQSHQPGPQRPQSVQTHTPQITVPAQVVAQHVRGGVANAAAGSFLSGLRTCTLNCTFPRLSLVKSLSTSRVSTASIVSFPSR